MTAIDDGARTLLAFLDAIRRECHDLDLVPIRTIAARLESPLTVVRATAELAEHWGLIESEPGEGVVTLRRSGEQYLAFDGLVDTTVLRFLPDVIDDLHARRALLCAGTVVVDAFREAIIRGRAVEHARRCVPDAFAPAVTDAMAIDLFAAAVALMARLSDGQPAGCVGEEVIAVELIRQAELWLVQELDEGRLTADAADNAVAELQSLFELFGDCDVIDMLSMHEPSDAAVALTSQRNVWLGVADQRTQNWFTPFADTAPTGHLAGGGNLSADRVADR
jgi:hypothetical protein